MAGADLFRTYLRSLLWGGQEHAGTTFSAYAPFRPEEAVTIDADGWGNFTCPFGGLRVWVRADDLQDSGRAPVAV